jgi:hypothetical protein
MTDDKKSVLLWTLGSLLAAVVTAAAAVYLWGFR